VYLVWFSGLAVAGLFCGIGWYLAPLEPNVLALQFAFTPRAFGEVVHLWTGSSLARFRAHLPADCVLLLSYGWFGYLLAAKTQIFGALRHWPRVFATWALPLAAAFDATENALHWWLTEVPRFGVQVLYLVAATSASAKWVLLVAYACVVAVALGKAK
jgi:hypothetical protein